MKNARIMNHAEPQRATAAAPARSAQQPQVLGVEAARSHVLSTMVQPLRLYRSLLQAQRAFPEDSMRAAKGQDMRQLLSARIRRGFEASRGATGAQVSQLIQTGEAELAALRTITSDHFATEYPSQMGTHGSVPVVDDDNKPRIDFQIFGKFWKS